MNQFNTIEAKALMRVYLEFAQYCLKYDGSEPFNSEYFDSIKEMAARFPPFTGAREPLAIFSFPDNGLDEAIKNNLDEVPSLIGQEAYKTVDDIFSNDARFRHSAWREKPYFIAVLRQYGKLIRQLQQDEHEGCERFHLDRFISALAPTNSILTNPEVMQCAIDSGGESLRRGLKAISEDWNPETGLGRIRSVNISAHKLGDDLAATSGFVVYRSDIFELIYYPSAGNECFERPVLIVPPWINRFYILDLTKATSFVRWLRQHGQSVFIISWRNPCEGGKNFSMEDYAEGLIEAADWVSQLCQCASMNVVGYCIGGTLAAMTYAVKRDTFAPRVYSLTLLTTLLDFENAGDLCYLFDFDVSPAASHFLDEKALLPSEFAGAAFQYLRPNRLIWPNMIRYYLLGITPPASPVMYWNWHGTNLSERVIVWLKQNAYGENRLGEGRATLFDNIVDFRTLVSLDAYMVATEKDHIAPWRAVYSSATRFLPQCRFILGQSGHIGGIVHRPEAGKYHYRALTPKGDANTALLAAEQYTGSWWHDWRKWLQQRSGKKRRTITIDKENILEAAPGRYVQE